MENLTGQGTQAKEISVSFEIEKIEIINGELVIIGKDGRKEVFLGGKNTTITSKVSTTINGITQTEEKIYYIDKEGFVSEPQQMAQGGKPNKENTEGVDKNGQATDISAKGIRVSFENTADSKYAFEVPDRALTKDYLIKKS